MGHTQVKVPSSLDIQLLHNLYIIFCSGRAFLKLRLKSKFVGSQVLEHLVRTKLRGSILYIPLLCTICPPQYRYIELNADC